MGIYIPNMEMPKYTTKAEFGIDADGNPLCMVYHEDGTEPDIYDVVPLPEGHGRLIDADAIRSEIDQNRPGRSYEDSWALTILDHATTIVPAEGGGE